MQKVTIALFLTFLIIIISVVVASDKDSETLRFAFEKEKLDNGLILYSGKCTLKDDTDKDAKPVQLSVTIYEVMQKEKQLRTVATYFTKEDGKYYFVVPEGEEYTLLPVASKDLKISKKINGFFKKNGRLIVGVLALVSFILFIIYCVKRYVRWAMLFGFFSLFLIPFFFLLIKLSTVAAAIIGAGAAGLYYLYNSYLLRPKIEIKTEDGEKIKSTKFLLLNRIIEWKNGIWVLNGQQVNNNLPNLFSDIKEYVKKKKKIQLVMPCIDVYLVLQNTGNATAEGCGVEVEFTQIDGDKKYWRARWGEDNQEKIDLQPGHREILHLIRIFPHPKSVKEINRRLRERGCYYQLESKFYRALQPVSEESEELPYNDDLSLIIQYPKRKSFEERRDAVTDVWWGMKLKYLKKAYTLDLRIGAKDLKYNEENIKIKISEILQKGEWQDNIKENNRWDDLREILDELGWKKNS